MIDSFIQQDLHSELERRMKNIPSNYGVFNSFKLDDPESYADCSPEKDWRNFQHLVNGDVLMYCEIANTSPVAKNGYSILCEKTIRHRAMTSGLFTDESLQRMNDCLAGTKVYMHDVFLRNPFFEKGEFISSWLCDDNVDGFGIKDLCCLAWVKQDAYENAVFRDLAYMAFGITVNYETCYKCGRKSTKEVNCPHLESKTASSVYDFKNFFGVSIYTAPWDPHAGASIEMQENIKALYK